MKKILPIIIMMVLGLGLAACQNTQATNAPTAIPTTAPSTIQPTGAAQPALSMSGKEAKNLNLDEIMKLPSVIGQGGIKSSTGKITPPTQFKGVPLTELVKLIGGADASMAIQLEAKDGYSMTFSFDQIDKGEFITYDPATGDETKNAGKLQAILAYEMDGKLLDVDRDGQLRLMVVSEKNNQVVDGHWSVKFVNKLNLKPMAADWSLTLVGAITDKIDRGSFESCSTGKCHPASFKDDKAQTWTGTPLYNLVGRVDDENKHDTGAYNRALADLGYTVEVVAKDGYSATFDSARLKDNLNIMVAYALNGNPLTDKDFPLKLVGSDVQKKENVGAIDKIIVHFGAVQPTVAATATSAPTATPAPTSAASSDGALALAGLVENPLSWKLADLKKLEVVKLSVEHPKKGKIDVEGVRLSALLDLGKVKPEAKSLVITAKDGFSAETDLKVVRDCKDCLVSFDSSGVLTLAMPEMASNLWVKDIARLDVK